MTTFVPTMNAPAIACFHEDRDDLTAVSLVADHPHNADKRSPSLYGTGDLVRWRFDEDSNTLGRRDDQIRFAAIG